MKKIDVLIADDHDLVLQGFIFMLRSFPFVQSVEGVNNGRAVLDYLEGKKPDLILMDLNMPELDGISTSELLLLKYPDIRIIILSGFNDDQVIYQAIELGVHGYLLKDTTPDELKKAIQKVITEGFYYNDAVVRIMRKGIIQDSRKTEANSNHNLSDREIQILKLLCHEKTTKEIASEVFLSDRTIEKIRKQLAHKLEVKGTAGLIRFAVKNGYDL